LHRTTRRLSLTDAGEAYVDRLRAILLDIDDADASVSSQTQELAGVLHVSVPPVLATPLLGPLIAGFRQRYPHIRFDVDVDPVDSPSIEDHDITLLATNAEFDANVIARRIITTEAILVAAPSYLQRRGTPQEPEELSQHECLRLRMPGLRAGSWRLILDGPQGRQVDVPVTPVLWVNHTDTLLRAALDGAGITSAPALDVAAPYLASGELVRVLPLWIAGRMSIYAALPSRKFMPQRSRVFLDYLVEKTRQLAGNADSRC
jgi:DNA-binding transcriptional LysR family regulator